MSLKIRMSRAGAKKRPFYRIVVTDSRFSRDGRFIERLGSYDPMLGRENEKRVVLDLERIKHWLSVGALPSDRVARFLGDAGVMAKPVYHEQPQQSQPKKKAQERLKAAAEPKAESAA